LIFGDLLRPSLRIVSWKAPTGTPDVAVPEAPVNEDYLLLTGEGHVRLAWKVVSMEPKTMAHLESHSTNL
jgi:hypothetical protein